MDELEESMRWVILSALMLVTTAALGDEPSATAKAERARTVELKRQRDARKTARGVAQKSVRAQALSTLNNQMVNAAQQQQASAEATRMAFVGGTSVRTPAPVICGPNALIVTRSASGQTWTSLAYPTGPFYPDSAASR